MNCSAVVWRKNRYTSLNISETRKRKNGHPRFFLKEIHYKKGMLRQFSSDLLLSCSWPSSFDAGGDDNSNYERRRRRTRRRNVKGKYFSRHGCLKHETRFYHFISNFNNFWVSALSTCKVFRVSCWRPV